VRRVLPFVLERSGETAPAGDGLDFAGYASVFNELTLIDSWEGRFQEQCAPGCFRKTIKERTPVLQFDHGRHPLIGSLPVGAITELAEDDRGLAVEARLHDTWLTEPLRAAIASGSISGMSFRFTVVREQWKDAAGKTITDPRELLELLYEPGDRGPLVRTLLELKVPELGPVVFPAYPGTTASLRAHTPALRTEVARSGRRGES
jgi:HK97 family phage prohead protease